MDQLTLRMLAAYILDNVCGLVTSVDSVISSVAELTELVGKT